MLALQQVTNDHSQQTVVVHYQLPEVIFNILSYEGGGTLIRPSQIWEDTFRGVVLRDREAKSCFYAPMWGSFDLGIGVGGKQKSCEFQFVLESAIMDDICVCDIWFFILFLLGQS